MTMLRPRLFSAVAAAAKARSRLRPARDASACIAIANPPPLSEWDCCRTNGFAVATAEPFRPGQASSRPDDDSHPHALILP